MTGTLSFTSGAWSAGGTTYTATYGVSDANVNLANVTVDVTGAQDANGNVQTDYTAQPEFSIDTTNPDVISFAIVDLNQSPASQNNYTSTDLGSADHQFLEIVGDGDQTLETNEIGYRLSTDLNSAGGLLNHNKDALNDRVLVTGTALHKGEVVDATNNITFENDTGFGQNDAYLNNNESIKFKLTGNRSLAKLVFTVHAIGSSASVSLASDGSITTTTMLC